MATAEPLISVIVPVYNVEDYLARCVRSLTGQTYANLEIILVDDGSPDRCGALCDELASEDPRIRVIHQVNGGLSDARNSGLDVATGSLVAFVDSDDCVHPRMMESLQAAMAEEQADISACYFRSFSDQTPTEEDDSDERVILEHDEALEAFFSYDAVNMTLAWNKLYKAELFEDVRYPKGKTREDEFTTHRLVYKAHRLVFVKRHLYWYFIRPGSIMHGNSMKNERFYAEAQEQRIAFFDEMKLDRLALKAIVKYSLWLMATSHRYRRNKNQEVRLFLGEIREKRKDLVREWSERKPMSTWLRLALKPSFRPWMDYIAFRRVYRNDERAARWLGDPVVRLL